MDTPHEPQRGRILAFPFGPARTDREEQRPRRGDPTGDDHLIDETPAPGDAIVSHLRALPLGISSGAFYPATPTEDVPDEAAALGIHTVELMLQTAGEYAPDFIHRTCLRAQDAGVEVRSLHTMQRLHPLMDPYARRAREGRELFERGIEAAAALDAAVLVWHGPRAEDLTEDGDWERFLEITAELAAACGRVGVTLGLENVSWCTLSTVRDVVRLATQMDEVAPAEHLGFVFDPFQAMRAEANPFMVLAAMGNRLANVHISDFDEDRPYRNHLPPGEGSIPWSAMLRAIAGSGYNGPLIVESPLGDDPSVIDHIRGHIEPRIRSIFDFPPDAATRPQPPLPEPERLPDGVREGIELFNERRFFEAHEVIEHEWHAERGPIRRLYQGILQIGVGFYHALNGNHKGAVLLLTDGIQKTSGFLPDALGVDTARLVDEAGACLQAIETLGPDRLREFDPTTVPVVHTSANHLTE